MLYYFDDLISFLFDLSNLLQAIFGLFSIYGVYTFVMNWLPKKVDLSIGSFSIKRKYFDVQNITNVVSANFYEGGQVPSDIRKEIIDITCPKVKKIHKKAQRKMA